MFAGPTSESTCLADQFPCPFQDKCISLAEVCDGVNDCSSGVDEMSCPDTDVSCEFQFPLFEM